LWNIDLMFFFFIFFIFFIFAVEYRSSPDLLGVELSAEGSVSANWTIRFSPESCFGSVVVVQGTLWVVVKLCGNVCVCVCVCMCGWVRDSLFLAWGLEIVVEFIVGGQACRHAAGYSSTFGAGDEVLLYQYSSTRVRASHVLFCTLQYRCSTVLLAIVARLGRVMYGNCGSKIRVRKYVPHQSRYLMIEWFSSWQHTYMTSRMTWEYNAIQCNTKRVTILPRI